jgi:hypothetical protein
MAAAATQAVLDMPAAEFRLPATDGKTYALDDVAGEKGTVIVFICNHCPYVKAVIDRMASEARVLMSSLTSITRYASRGSVPAEIRPHICATLAAGPANETRLQIGQLTSSGQASPLIAMEWLRSDNLRSCASF